MFSHNHHRPRRGVVLMIILGLMAMFGMVILTFVLVAGQGQRAAKSFQRSEENPTSPKDQLQQAALQLFRGSNWTDSALRQHSLLEDMYGTGTSYGHMASGVNVFYNGSFVPPPAAIVRPACSGQIIEFTPLQQIQGLYLYYASFNQGAGTWRTAQQMDTTYAGLVGRVLTIRGGPFGGQSTRIVGYDDNSNLLQILPFENVSSADFVTYMAQLGAVNQSLGYIINGAPFSGTGFGLGGDGLNEPCLTPKPGDPFLQLALPLLLPYALLPNRVGDPSQEVLQGSGGANEDYDAVDYQNMLLAMMDDQGQVIIPSLHRAALINYWYDRLVYQWPVPLLAVSLDDEVNHLNRWRAVLHPAEAARRGLISTPVRDVIIGIKRRIFFRPRFDVHTNFSGSNPRWADWQKGNYIGSDGNRHNIFDSFTDHAEIRDNFWLAQSPVLHGPWDVDNSGDGVPDSIWVDFGFPIYTAPDGRRYKPLFAPLCVDLDGRLNLNAQGCVAQTNADSTDPLYFYDVPDLSSECMVANRLFAESQRPVIPGGLQYFDPSIDADNDGVPDYLAEYYAYYHGPRGLGRGPAEINLMPLFDDGTGTYPYAAQYGNLLWGIVGLDGRYGESSRLPTQLPGPGPSWWQAGWQGTTDLLTLNKFFYWWYYDAGGSFNWRRYDDADGVFGTPSDLRGYLSVGLDLAGQPAYTSWRNQLPGNPLPGSPYQLKLAGGASPFDRPFRPVELERLLRPYDLDAPHLPPRLTRLSSQVFNRRHEVTTESWDLPCPNLAKSPGMSGGVAPGHLVSLITSKLTAAGCANVVQQLEIMLSPDCLAGLRMDLNRPFGNGDNDDTSNTVVDDFFVEAQSGAEALQLRSTTSASGYVTPLLDHDNDGAAGANVEDPRQQYARHLYVLARALVDWEGLKTYMDDRYSLGGDSGDSAVKEAYAARCLAQWAVNVADFRDRDSIMTGFAYDPTPFDNNGWSPSQVVWGCERPELLITETVAFHDRRTENLQTYGDALIDDPNDDNSEYKEPKGDGERDLDSRYRPQGTLVVEVYNPWRNSNASSQMEPMPDELYDSGGVNLAKTTPQGTGNYPVWRLAIHKPADTNPERAVYFAGAQVDHGSGAELVQFPNDASVQYYRSILPADTTPVVPGQYAVIGPGGPPNNAVTYLGFESAGTQGVGTTRHVDLNPAANADFVKNNDTTVPPGVQPAVGIVVDRAKDSAGADIQDSNGNDAPPRLSVSEPTTGYAPIEALRSDENDEPLHYEPNNGKYVHLGADQVTDKPIDRDNPTVPWSTLGSNGTTAKFRIVYLQRLADPLQPFHAVTNPYLTIDAMAVDLTSFNGREDQAILDYQEPPNDASQMPEFATMFDTRQRGQFSDDDDPDNDGDNNYFEDADNVNKGATAELVLWKQEPFDRYVEDNDTDPIPGGTHYFTRKLEHSLGYLSEHFGLPRDTLYAGSPQMPFPWLTWLNRPFASPLEIMLVPSLSSEELLAYGQDSTGAYDYYQGFRIVRSTDEEPRPYEPRPPTVGPGGVKYSHDVPFHHLLNFFDSSIKQDDSPQLHRLLEYVRVASPFVETELQPNPASMVGGTNHKYHPPNHMISRYREPGRLNLNTIFSPRVFRGLLNLPSLGPGLDPIPDFLDPTDITTTPTTLWHRFVQSRRGYYDRYSYEDPPLSGNWVEDLNLRDPALMDPTGQYPTRFARPFRSFSGAHWVPPTRMDDPSTPPDESKLLQNTVGREINSTILRTHPKDTNGQHGLFDTVSPLHVNNTRRNPFFDNQMARRLANLVTTRSNVYAVWITVGYFEVVEASLPTGWNAAQYQAVYPQGYRLGDELGTDTGEINRHRAFYLFDRSIPVGFERGRDNNVEDAILLERFIE